MKQKAAGKTLTSRCRWFNAVPQRDGADARLVDGVGVTVPDAKGKVTYNNAFVTSLDVTRDSVAEIVSCATARRLWVDARTAKRARQRFFEPIRTITAYLVFPDWNTLMQTLIGSKPPPKVKAQIGQWEKVKQAQ